MVVEIQKILCGSRNIENLIKPTYFYLNSVESTFFVQILVKSACFAMTIIKN